jgi:hypothetical protein
MTTPSISIPADAMQQVVAKAIMEGLTEDQRTSVIASAVQYLLTPQKVNSWDREGPTPVEVAFKNAVDKVVREVAFDMVEANEDLRAKIRDMVQDAIAAVLRDDSAGYDLRENVVTTLAGTLRTARWPEAREHR